MPAIEIQKIFISSGHGFIGQHPDQAKVHQMESVQKVECVAGKGLLGDRFFDYKPDYLGQATFFSAEVFNALLAHLGGVNKPLFSMRRNIMLSGVDLNSLIGQIFEINGVRFSGSEECSPCRWMDRSIGDGARAFLKDRGGLRVRILESGILATGPSELKVIGAAA